MTARRISVVAPGVPHPSKGASSVLFYWYIDALKAAGHKLQIVILLSEGRDAAALALDEFAENLGSRHTIEVCPAYKALPVLFETRFGVGEHSRPEVVRAVESFRPDVILSFDLNAAAITRGIRANLKIVWLGDLNFDSGWYHFLYGLREKPLTIRHAAYAVARRLQWRNEYTRILARDNLVIASSASSVAKLTSLGIASEYQPYPWPSDGPPHERSLPSQPTFLFFGSLVGLGSRSSFHFLFRRIFPLLEKRWGSNFQILVSGREKLPDWVAAEMRARPQMRYLGFVEDIDTVLSAIHGVIAPIDVPVGNRSRILTALAKQVPVIAHSNVALGNPDLVDGVTCLLARGGQGFADRMIRAAEDPTSLDEMRQNGERLYMTRFAPRVAADQLVRTIEQRFSTLSVAA
jgi:glycosyltransferase involved in cell wall biosynthesis